MKTVSLNAEDESKDCFQHMCHLERYLLRKWLRMLMLKRYTGESG
jgi:hypothetical protein